MEIISKGEKTPHDGVLLTLEEYNQVLIEKHILDQMEKLCDKN